MALVHDDGAPAATERPVLSLDLEGVMRGGVPVLGPISLNVRPGETLAIVGPSGIGKTTLLRVVAGLQDGHRGRCEVAGKHALVFQEPRLLPWRSLRQNLTIATDITGTAADMWLADAGLEGRGDDIPGELSLGQQRRVAIVRALALNPALLLMDEPFASLDQDTADRMMEMFARLRARTRAATLFVTHAEKEARRLASRIITLGGRPAQIVEDRGNSPALVDVSAPKTPRGPGSQPL